VFLYFLSIVSPFVYSCLFRIFAQVYKPLPPGGNQISVKKYPPMKMEQTACSETSAYKIQTPGNYPEESIQRSEQGKISNQEKIYQIP
jgi:hypothetical protein